MQAGAELNATDKFGHTPRFDAAADVSPYDMIIATTGVAPSQRALEERSGRGAVIAPLKSRGAAPSPADAETAKAMGPVPEADRVDRHMALAHNSADFKYHKVVRGISMEYPFLHDAYRHLRKKTTLSPTEKVFVDNLQQYDEDGGLQVQVSAWRIHVIPSGLSF